MGKDQKPQGSFLVKLVACFIISFWMFMSAGSLAAQSTDALGSIALNEKFPELKLPTTDGSSWSIQDERGRRVILHIFASW